MSFLSKVYSNENSTPTDNNTFEAFIMEEVSNMMMSIKGLSPELEDRLAKLVDRLQQAKAKDKDSSFSNKISAKYKFKESPNAPIGSRSK